MGTIENLLKNKNPASETLDSIRDLKLCSDNIIGLLNGVDISASIKENQNLQQDAAKKIKVYKLTRRPLNSRKLSGLLHKKPARNFFFRYRNKRPNENKDTKVKKIYMEKIPLSFSSRRWTPLDINLLRKYITEERRKNLFAALIKKYSFVTASGSLDDFVAERDMINRMTEKDLLKVPEDFEWDEIASKLKRDPEEVRSFHMNANIRDISPWKRAEDKKLMKLVQVHGAHNWQEVAANMGKRTAFECLKRFQRSLNARGSKDRWTEEEDAQLLEAVQRYGQKNWQQVADYVHGRTGQQCLHRWTKTRNPEIKRGRWTVSEDKRLLVSATVYGEGNWVKIASHIPGRTDVQCRERWCNVLKPDLNTGAWTESEDKKLIETVNIHGVGVWAKVAIELYPRTDNQCWRRWKFLQSTTKEGDDTTPKELPLASLQWNLENTVTQPVLTTLQDHLKLKIIEEKHLGFIGLPTPPLVARTVEFLTGTKPIPPTQEDLDDEQPDGTKPILVPPLTIPPNSCALQSIPNNKTSKYALARLTHLLNYEIPKVHESTIDPEILKEDSFKMLSSVFNSLFQMPIFTSMQNVHNSQVRDFTDDEMDDVENENLLSAALGE